jgi:DinB family
MHQRQGVPVQRAAGTITEQWSIDGPSGTNGQGPRIDLERAHFWAVADARHQRRVDDHPDIRIVDKAFEAVTAAACHNPSSLLDGVLNSIDHLVGTVHEAHMVWLPRESFVESPADLETSWRLLASGQLAFEQPRHQVIRDTFLHSAHHRGQMTVYLRLLGSKVPSVYGPTADDRSFG